jgi:glycine betaine/proline transport system substrate-binding protein
MTTRRRGYRIAAALLALTTIAAACGGDDSSDGGSSAGTEAPSGDSAAPADTGGGASGEAIKLAVNPWTGSAVNANVAKVVLEGLGTPVELVALDENAAWVGLDSGDIDANLEIWPSGHVADYDTYITQKGTVVDLGKLGPSAKIGWYVPKFVVDEHPELAAWEGFADPDLAKLFATAESGDLGQFLMGDPSYVTYDEQIIDNLGLPLKYVVAGSEAALLTAIDQAIADRKPLLLQFWQPHWKQNQVELVEVKLPDITPACDASRAAADGKYACEYPVDELYKAANAGLEAKNQTAFAVLSKLQLTTEQQNEIAGYIDADGMDPLAAAEKWVADNADIVAGWTG